MLRKSFRWIYLLLITSISFPSLAASGTENDKQGAALYQEECASCHMAYPAGLLPARSWKKILSNLDKHFGDNASLDTATREALQQYLQQNSADVVVSRRARRLLRSIPAQSTPLRISELAYIRRRHDEIPQRYITANPQVKSPANCIACHQGAERGIFDEDSVRIPGYGRWDD